MEYRKLTDVFTMNSGRVIPCVGFGTWQTEDGETAVNAVRSAVKHGYRHIDTAAVYGNEKSVGEGIATCGIPRSELFVTSKLWTRKKDADSTYRAVEKTLADLRTDYLDLYLIHWPANLKNGEDWREINLGAWRAMEKLCKDGVLKSIGLSNFSRPYLDPILEDCEIVPAVNQIEWHPGWTQPELTEYCKSKGILVEAWSPLGCGRLLGDESLAATAAKYGKSTAQLCIRYALQHDVLPLPKSTHDKWILENTKVFDFSISDEDMKTLDAMPPTGWSGFDPDEIPW